MSEHTFHIELRRKQTNEYLRLCSPVSERILTQLTAPGIHEYSTFVEGDHVIGVFRFIGELKLAHTLEKGVDPACSSAVIALTSHRKVDEQLHVPTGITNVFRFEGRSFMERTAVTDVSFRNVGKAS